MIDSDFHECTNCIGAGKCPLCHVSTNDKNYYKYNVPANRYGKVSQLIGNYDIVLGFGPFISFLMILIYFRTKKAIKINYERNLISAGKESTLNYELFEEKIILTLLDKIKALSQSLTKFE